MFFFGGYPLTSPVASSFMDHPVFYLLRKNYWFPRDVKIYLTCLRVKQLTLHFWEARQLFLPSFYQRPLFSNRN